MSEKVERELRGLFAEAEGRVPETGRGARSSCVRSAHG